jgi:TfoX/Sxy family transcriptional regulator of competence genes
VGDASKAEAAFAEVTRAFAKDAEVSFGRLFASDGLKVRDKIFAMLVRGNLVVKLPKARVDALIAESKGARFDPGHGRLMKEWVVIAPGVDNWLAFAKEARSFVGGKG